MWAAVCRSSCNLTHPTFKRTALKVHGHSHAPTMTQVSVGHAEITTCASEEEEEGHYPQPWCDMVFCDNPTIHCPYPATIPQLTAHILRQSRVSLPIFCDNPTIHCPYSATIPRFTADILRQSHDSLPIFCDNPTIHCRYSATIPRFTADILRQSHYSLPIFCYNPTIHC